MRYLSEVIAVIREWIIATISRAAAESRGPVQVTAMEPIDPTQPPLRCAGLAERLEQLGIGLEDLLTEVQVTTEEFRICQESTLPPMSVAWDISEIMDTIGFMKQGSKRIQGFAKRRTK